MNVVIKPFTSEYAEEVLKLQQEWMYENITYGSAADTKESILSLPDDCFYM